MTEFFITARSFAAPFFSDDSSTYVEADTASEALATFASEYSHPAGLYAAEAWASADHYHKSGGKDPLAQWLSNHEIAKQEATKDKHGYGYLGHGPGEFDVDGERVSVPGPKGGRVVT